MCELFKEPDKIETEGRLEIDYLFNCAKKSKREWKSEIKEKEWIRYQRTGVIFDCLAYVDDVERSEYSDTGGHPEGGSKKTCLQISFEKS